MRSLSRSKLAPFILVIGFFIVYFVGRYLFISPTTFGLDKTKSVAINHLKSDCDFQVIAHRGNSYQAPENTLVSIDQAFQQGANFVEADIRLSKDGVPVLMHDPLLDRTTSGGGPVTNWKVSMLKTLDAGSWKGVRYKNEKIPTLAEAIRIMDGRGSLYLDIKVKGLAKAIASVLKENNFQANSVYPAVNSPEMLAEYHEQLPNTPLIWFRDIPDNWDEAWLNDLIQQGVVGFELYWPSIQKMPNFTKFKKMLADNSLYLWTYVINEQKAMQEIIQLGITGIETDRPHVLSQLACLGKTSSIPMESKILGHWNMTEYNLKAKIGSRLRHWGDVLNKTQIPQFTLASTMKLPLPGNQDKAILTLQKYSARQGIQMFPGLYPLDGSRQVNQYSLLMDIYRPSSSEGFKQALWQTHWRNKDEAELYINKNGSIGYRHDSVGKLVSDRWQRLIAVVDLSQEKTQQVKIYIDGVFQGGFFGGGLGGDFSIHSNVSSRPVLLFTDSVGNSAPLSISSIEFRDYAMTKNEVSNLGSVSVNGSLKYVETTLSQ